MISPLKAHLLNKILSIFLLFVFLIGCKEKEAAQPEEPITKEATSTKEKPSIQKDSSLTVDFITGHFNPAKDSSFVEISKKYADRHGMYMKKEAYEAFKKMWSDAQKENINLVIRSAARNFDYQKGIWERKWTGETILSNGENASKVYENEKDRALKILEYSSMPGTSRHHWGTDIDFNNFNNEWFESGEGLKLFNWLEKNAHEYGFCRPYTTKGEERPHGYNEEKWHWSFMPLSQKYTQFAKEHLNNNNISGFKGSNVADNIDIVNKYILGINHSCK